MGRRVSVSRASQTASNASAAIEIIANLRPMKVFEITISLQAATASIFGFGRPAALGVTPTLISMPLDEDRLGFVQQSNCVATAWVTPPTLPGFFYRRMSLAAAIGNKGTWTFANGLSIRLGASVVVWNQAANSIADIDVIGEEA